MTADSLDLDEIERAPMSEQSQDSAPIAYAVVDDRDALHGVYPSEADAKFRVGWTESPERKWRVEPLVLQSALQEVETQREDARREAGIWKTTCDAHVLVINEDLEPRIEELESALRLSEERGRALSDETARNEQIIRAQNRFISAVRRASNGAIGDLAAKIRIAVMALNEANRAIPQPTDQARLVRSDVSGATSQVETTPAEWLTPAWCMEVFYRVNPGAKSWLNPNGVPSLYLLDFAREVLRAQPLPAVSGEPPKEN